MRWPAVVGALVTLLEQDAAVLGALGGTPAIHPADDSGAGRVPSIAWSLISDTEAENTERLLVQWDVFAPSLQTAIAIERALRDLVATDGIADVGGVEMWMLLQGASPHPAPERGGVHRSVDVLYQPAREEI